MKRRIWTSGKKLNRLHTWQERPGIIVCAVCGDISGNCPHLIKFNNQQPMATDIQQASRATRIGENIRSVFTNYINNARRNNINIVEVIINQATFQSLLSPDFVTNSPFGRASYFGIDIRIVERGISDNVATFIRADGTRHVVSLLSETYFHTFLNESQLQAAYQGRPEIRDAAVRGITLTQLLAVQREGLDRNTLNDLQSIDRQMYEQNRERIGITREELLSNMAERRSIILERERHARHINDLNTHEELRNQGFGPEESGYLMPRNTTPVETIRNLGDAVREATNSVRQLNEALHGVPAIEVNES